MFAGWKIIIFFLKFISKNTLFSVMSVPILCVGSRVLKKGKFLQFMNFLNFLCDVCSVLCVGSVCRRRNTVSVHSWVYMSLSQNSDLQMYLDIVWATLEEQNDIFQQHTHIHLILREWKVNLECFVMALRNQTCLWQCDEKKTH